MTYEQAYELAKERVKLVSHSMILSNRATTKEHIEYLTFSLADVIYEKAHNAFTGKDVAERVQEMILNKSI